MHCFFLRIEKEEECQNLLFLSSSVKVGLYLWKPGTKEKRLKNDVRKLYLQNHEKTRTSWLNFGEDTKKEARRKSWTLGIFQEIGSLTYSERLAQNLKLERYFEKFFFYKVEGLKTLLIHKKQAHNEVVFPAKSPLETAGQKLNSDRRPCLHSEKEAIFFYVLDIF